MKRVECGQKCAEFILQYDSSTKMKLKEHLDQGEDWAARKNPFLCALVVLGRQLPSEAVILGIGRDEAAFVCADYVCKESPVIKRALYQSNYDKYDSTILDYHKFARVVLGLDEEGFSGAPPPPSAAEIDERARTTIVNVLVTPSVYVGVPVVKELGSARVSLSIGGTLIEDTYRSHDFDSSVDELRETIVPKLKLVLSNYKNYADIAVDLASHLHEEWRVLRVKPDGAFEPRLKRAKDGKEVDIANTDYINLPREFQEENFRSAIVVVKQIAAAIGSGRGFDDSFIEEASFVVHDEWVRRNASWAPAKQKVPYSALSEAEKEKDRVMVKKGIQMVQAHLAKIGE